VNAAQPRKPRKPLRALLVALLGCLLLSGCDFDVYKLPLPGGADTGEDPMTITVEFRDVLDLVPKSTVKVNDVTVGQVTDIDLNTKTNVAMVDIELRRDTELPADAIAELRQTSLLGEKFVQLAPGDSGTSEMLEDGDTIPVERSGRNPEVEEVFGALSLLLNGGGVAQLKTIVSELNKTFEGREDTTKSVLRQIEVFMSQLDDNKEDIVDAIESVNRLALGVRAQQRTIDATLEELPSSLVSLDRQRDDLVNMLEALERLSGVGVRVISKSKDVTIQALRQLEPTLTELANSGDDFVDSFSVFLTYPFVDEVVGRDPSVARQLHMGDYTNLSVQLDVDLTGESGPPPIPVEDCTPLSEIPDTGPLPNFEDLCEGAQIALAECAQNFNRNCIERVLGTVCEATPNNPICDNLPDLPGLPTLPGTGANGNNGNNGGGGGLPDVPELPGLGRAPSSIGQGPTVRQLSDEFDPALVMLLVPGMVVQ
jgi:phospholipid/cholesterol/gamma-HCH transport system substrate-binding protein